MVWHTPDPAFISGSIHQVNGQPGCALRLESVTGSNTIGPVYLRLTLPDDMEIDSVTVCYERPSVAPTEITATRLVQLREPTSETILAEDTTVRSEFPPTCYSIDVADVVPNGAVFLKLDVHVFSTFYVEIGAVGIKMKNSATAISFDDASVPEALRLFQNRPNPTASETAIDFETATAGRTRLSIFDVSGRRIRTLVDEHRPAGRHDAVWDGRNDNGVLVAPGVYFYQLELDGQTTGRRMVRLR
jgi:hypothetical protein